MKYQSREGVSWPYTSFDYTADITMASSIRCPECKEASVLADWTESDVSCEDCGEHTALQCPRCLARIDHVYAKPFEVVKES